MGKDIGKRICEIRRSMKLTQSQFAELVNLSEDSIGKIERGITIPRSDTLLKIAEALNVTTDDLLHPSKEVSRKKASVLKDFIAYLNTRSAEDISFIHEITVTILGRKK